MTALALAYSQRANPAGFGTRFAREGRRRYGRSDRPGDLSEKILHAAWRRAAERRLTLRSHDGHAYTVLYPGRPGGSFGPDFVDAIIERDDGARMCGEVEIHVRASGWRQHGHDRDPRYNGVAFHVVLETGGAESTTNSAGLTIPLLPLGPALEPGRAAGTQASTWSDSDPPPLPLPFLDMGRAGDERFANRSSGLQLDIDHFGLDQTLYRAVLEALGYPRNKRGFRQLAAAMPWADLVSGLHTGGADKELSERLEWAAGFGEKPPGAPPLRANRPDWTLAAGRPDNHPRRRVRAAAALAARWMAAAGPATAMREAVLRASDPKELALGFKVGPPTGMARALVGESRAREIVVNALLPGIHAAATVAGDQATAHSCIRLYREHPPLSENSILREAALVLSAHGLESGRGGAREQQGLIHTYRLITARTVRSRQLPML